MLHWILYLTYYYTTLGLKYFLLFRLFQFSGYGFGDVSKLPLFRFYGVLFIILTLSILPNYD